MRSYRLETMTLNHAAELAFLPRHRAVLLGFNPQRSMLRAGCGVSDPEPPDMVNKDGTGRIRGSLCRAQTWNFSGKLVRIVIARSLLLSIEGL